MAISFDSNLDHETQKAYLDSMGVTQWIPRAEAAPEMAIQPNGEQIEQESAEVLVDSEVQLAPQLEREQTEASTKDSLAAKHYLKLVNWQNQLVKEEGSKSLLILCRHQIDQPASSFATSSPSQFMMDLLNGLLSLVETSDSEIRIQLAHLATAGLTDESVDMQQHLNRTAPDLVLVLGDEALKQLLGEEIEVSFNRGKIIDYNQQKLLTSYHPFSLINNPSLKSLALEDLKEVSNFLRSLP